MSDLAPFVLAFMRDESLERLLEENRQFRKMIRYVTVQVVGPDQHGRSAVVDHEGLNVFFQDRVDLLKEEHRPNPSKTIPSADSGSSSNKNKGGVINLKSRGFYPLEYPDLLKMKIRFGDLCESPLVEEFQKCSFFVVGAAFNRRGQSGWLVFEMKVEDENDETAFTVYGTIGGSHVPYSVQNFSEISGLTVDEILSSMNYDRVIGDGYFMIDHPFDPIRVEVDTLEQMFGGDFHFELTGAKVPLRYAKKKCHVL